MIWSLLTGRLVREKVDPAVQSAVDSQVRDALLIISLFIFILLDRSIKQLYEVAQEKKN